MWAINGDTYKPSTYVGLSITFGSLLGLTMGANVWMIIWPNQQVNIASAETVAAGGQADPAAAGAAMAAGRASRVNAFFSIPMAFFMVFTSHFAPVRQAGWRSRRGVDHLPGDRHLRRAERAGKLPGGLRQPFSTMVLADHKKTIYAGLIFTAMHVLHRLGADHRLVSRWSAAADRHGVTVSVPSMPASR